MTDRLRGRGDGRARHRRSPGEREDPFAALGLPARGDLTDEDVRAAWRRIAAVTHPDLDAGGDPARFSAAAAAYDTLRTSFGRGEALADLGLGASPAAARRPRRHRLHRVAGTRQVARPLARLVAGPALVIITAVAVVGWTPASIALLVGAVTWLLASRRRHP